MGKKRGIWELERKVWLRLLILHAAGKGSNEEPEASRRRAWDNAI